MSISNHPEPRSAGGVPNGSIAITGIGCRFPGGAHGPDAFWKMLSEGVDAITEIPPDRWNINAYFDPQPGLPGKTNSKWGGFLERLEQFDAGFFGISPREAACMDPQQRLLLEAAWESLEDAGMVVPLQTGSRTGVFVGISTYDYSHMQSSASDKTSLEAHTTTGSVLSIAANRISYLLNFQGPSFVVDTACSSSLVAVHLACQSLRRGECTTALAGGVNALLTPDTFISFSRMSMLSPDGRCKAFDARGNGFVRGEGVGVVVLKPLEAAIQEGDRIYAVIRGSAVNQDGRTSSLTVPGRPAQERLIQSACEDAGVDPSQIAYVEAHGTGTAIGDPIETAAIGTVIGKNRKHGTCLIGSVKTNIGHLEAGSGIAGLIKTALVLHHGKVPPNLHFQTPNPEIDFEGWKLKVPTREEPLPQGETLASLNSFGFGGTNAHVVLQGVPQRTPTLTTTPEAPTLFLLSARSEQGLKNQATHYIDWLASTPDTLENVCHSLAHRRTPHAHRLAIASPSKTDVIEKLQAFVNGETRPGLSTGLASEPQKMAFVFTGQGPQWWAMGRELLNTHDGFRQKIESCDALFRQWGDWSLIEELSRSEATSRMDSPAIAQPAIFALQIGLCAWWEEMGVCPGAVIGHSVGEAAAAHISGVLDLPSAARVIFERGRCMQLVPPTGKMLAVALAPEAITPWLAGLKRWVEIGAVNSPRSVTLAGQPKALEQIAERLEKAKIWCRFLRVNFAFHSAQMDPVKSPLKAALRDIRSQAARIPMCSSVTAQMVTKEKLEAEYWWKNVREPVRFADGIQTLIRDGFTAFVEVGPHPALSGPVSECLKAEGTTGLVVPSLRRGEPEQLQLLSSLGTLQVNGFSVRPSKSGHPVRLPLMVWQKEPHWHELEESKTRRLAPPAPPLLGIRLCSAIPTWNLKILRDLLPWLEDHRLSHHVVFPAAGYVEMALEAAREIHGPGTLIVEDVEFTRALFVSENDHPHLELRVEESRFQIASLVGKSGTWTPNCHGTLRHTVTSGSCAALDSISLKSRCIEEVEGAAIYELFAKNGFQFGKSFQRVQKIWRRDGEALGHIVPPETGLPEIFQFHPTLLDACFQVLLTTLRPEQSAGRQFLPVAIERLKLLGEITGPLWSHVCLLSADSGSITANIEIANSEGTIVATIEAFRCAALEESTKVRQGPGCFFDITWREVDEPELRQVSTQWFFVGKKSTTSEALKRSLVAAGDNVQEVTDLQTLNGRDGIHVLYCAFPAGAEEDSTALCADALKVANTLTTTNATLTVLTERGQPVGNHFPSPAQAALIGLFRVFRNESSSLLCRLIDIDTVEPEHLVRILKSSLEEEAALRNQKLLVPRLVPIELRPAGLDGAKTPFRLEIVKAGSLDQVAFQKFPRRAPLAGEVEIEVQAAGLNFRDVMKVLGIYPIEQPGDLLLGDECSGRVTAVGEGVQHLKPGDDVLTIFPGSFSKFVTVPAAFCAKQPAHLTHEDAATIPVTFLTAHYALHHLARIEPGEKVLIHAAAGGVGIAALQIAKAAGAEIFATAGSPEKRELVRNLGAAHVMDSRSLEFAEEIQRLTNGRGVDIVLNSLSGQAIPRSLASLAPYGRFLEIGKRDIYQNSRLGLKPFRKNLSFFAIDLSQLLRDRPDFVSRMLNDLMSAFESKTLQPLPHTDYPISNAPLAFREMAQGRHVGKLVFSLDAPNVRVQATDEDRIHFDESACYLITGGVRGFGMAMAEWMISRGAKNLILLGASSDSVMAARKHFKEMPGVQAEAVDVSNLDALSALFDELAKRGLPLRGVIHAAMKMDDGLCQDLTPDRLATVLGPKAGGAWNLHLLTRDLNLDFFVMVSSISSLVGNPGQGNYAAANAFLDALTHLRHSQNLPALTINWGHLGEVGYAARHSQVSSHLERYGFPAMGLQEAMGLLEKMMLSKNPRVAAMRVDWNLWAQANPRAKKSPLYTELICQDSENDLPGSGGLAEAILNASEAERKKLLEAFIRETAARVLGMPASKIDPSRPLNEIGLDSLMSIELVNRIEEGLGMKFPIEKLVGGPNIITLAKILSAAMPSSTGNASR